MRFPPIWWITSIKLYFLWLLFPIFPNFLNSMKTIFFVSRQACSSHNQICYWDVSDEVSFIEFFRCISQHLPLSVGGWVIVSDFGDSYHIFRACELVSSFVYISSFIAHSFCEPAFIEHTLFNSCYFHFESECFSPCSVSCQYPTTRIHNSSSSSVLRVAKNILMGGWINCLTTTRKQRRSEFYENSCWRAFKDFS